MELLKNILRLFKSVRNNIKILQHLTKEKIIHSTFEKTYLLNNVDFDFEIIEKQPKNEDLIEFYLEANDGSPYKVELIFEEKWYLKSFHFQCQSCFGEDEECKVCGGLGWGVL